MLVIRRLGTHLIEAPMLGRGRLEQPYTTIPNAHPDWVGNLRSHAEAVLRWVATVSRN